MTIKKILATLIALAGCIGLTNCSTSHALSQKLNNYFSSSPNEQINLQAFPNSPAFWQSNVDTIWDGLQSIPLSRLRSAMNQATDTTIKGWIRLAIISKQYSTRTAELINQLIEWRAENPNHPGNQLFPDNATLSSIASSPPPRHITLLLPLKGTVGAAGRTVRDGFLNAYYTSSLKSQRISMLDTSQHTDMGALYQQALHNGSDLVIGPLTKEEVQNILNQGNFPVPTVALNYTTLGFGSLPTNFYEFGLSPEDEAQQLATKAYQAGRRRAIVIATQNDWGQRVANKVIDQWQNLGGKVTDTLYVDNKTNLTDAIPALLHVDTKADQEKMKSENNQATLQQQRRQDFDVVFLLTTPTTARQVVPLLRFYYAGNVPIYATSSIYSGRPSPQNDMDLNGVIFCDLPWVLKHARGSRLFAVGRDAFLLGKEINRISKMPRFPIYGATGALTVNEKHQIYRRLPWIVIRNGKS